MQIRFPYALALLLIAGCASLPREPDSVRHVRPNDETASSSATVVGESALVHTDQFFPLGADGRVAGEGDVSAQVTRTMENLRTALQLAGSDFGSLAKLNVYLADDSLRTAAGARLADVLPDEARPAISYVTTRMERAGVLLAVDAVAVSPRDDGTVSFLRSESLRDSGGSELVQGSRGLESVDGSGGSEVRQGSRGQAHAAVMPAGAKIYVSGQAQQGERPEAVAATMESLFATLAYLDLGARDVVQVKAFIHSMSDASAVENQIEAYFREKPAPPIITTEWRQDNYPAEIELIASRRAGAERPGDLLTFVTPPGMSSSPLFSRVVEVGGGELVYVSGIYGTAGDADRGQVEQTFGRLVEVLHEAGSDIEHLVKATYYYTTDESGSAINNVRTDLYNADRPPAASKIVVRGAGLSGAAVTLDMIAVVPE